MAEQISPEFLKDLYRKAGLSPSDQELQALLPVVQGFYDGVPVVEEIMRAEDEPLTAFTLPRPQAEI
jgi:hypothetical protein